MVTATTDEESRNMAAPEADAFKMFSTMVESAETSTSSETREGALKMVAEAPKKLEMAAGELNLMESEAGTTTTEKEST